MDKQREELIKRLKETAKKMRKMIVKTALNAGQGHIAPALSASDFTAALYFHIMKIDPGDQKCENRDRFILSAGHKCLVQYAALALLGFFPKEDLNDFDRMGSYLGGHPIYNACPGIEASTGSLGHGLSIGIGMAIAGKRDNKDHRIFVIMGDGECNEGANWEAAMAASKFKLDNLIAIVDYNKLSIDGFISNVMPLEPLYDKWVSFGWACREINGNNMEEIVDALEKVPFEKDKPSVIIAHTTKGKGVSFMEGKAEWHGKTITSEEAERAVKEIEIMK